MTTHKRLTLLAANSGSGVATIEGTIVNMALRRYALVST